MLIVKFLNKNSKSSFLSNQAMSKALYDRVTPALDHCAELATPRIIKINWTERLPTIVSTPEGAQVGHLAEQ